MCAYPPPAPPPAGTCCSASEPDLAYGSLSHRYPSGNYSFAKACVGFQRNPGSYQVQMFLACIYVIMSYMGCWITRVPPSRRPS